MTSGLHQLCKLWLGLSKGKFPVVYLAQKILTAVNYCGRLLARRLKWAAPAYHVKDGAIPHPEACRFTLQYDERPDGRFEVRIWT